MYIALRNVDPSLSVRTTMVIIACKKVWSYVTAPVTYDRLMQPDRTAGSTWRLAGDTSHCDDHRN